MKVVAGRLKGRTIQFPNKKFGNADITSQKVKEAVFSMFGDDIRGRRFLDLYACSGQMAFEAYSRGALVYVNESDRKRFDFIWNTAERFGILGEIRLFNYTDTVCLRYLSKKEPPMEYCYLDPPYTKTRGPVAVYGKLLSAIDSAGILAGGATVAVQYYSKNEFSGIPESFSLTSVKEYGTTSVSLFEYDPSPADQQTEAQG